MCRTKTHKGELASLAHPLRNQHRMFYSRDRRSFRGAEWRPPGVQKVNPLTGAIKVVGDGVQEGVLWSEEPLHHRHLDQLEKSAADSQAAAAASISSEDLGAAPRCLTTFPGGNLTLSSRQQEEEKQKDEKRRRRRAWRCASSCVLRSCSQVLVPLSAATSLPQSLLAQPDSSLTMLPAVALSPFLSILLP